LDVSLQKDDPARFARQAAELEEMSFDAAFSVETAHDPFLPLAVAAGVTSRMGLGTGIAVAFARNPMTVAVLGSDLHRLTEGRFILGLGSQIKAHITRRFSMPWSQPAARMREFVTAVRSIWACWDNGAPLSFNGDFYNYSLMSPKFNPGPNPFGAPRVFISAVGPEMIRAATAVADGMFVHGFTTPRYLAEITRPAVLSGLDEADRSRNSFELSQPIFVITGSAESIAKQTDDVRRQIAFYGSTPAYRPVLAHHGWGDLADRLNDGSKRGDWEAMAASIDDEVVHTFAIVAKPQDVATEIVRRYAGLLDRVQLTVDSIDDGPMWRTINHAIRHQLSSVAGGVTSSP
jgi:probable F420-dependent oxidoreductase